MLVVSHTKTGRVRRVPVPPELLAELRARGGRLVAFPRSSLASFTRTARRLSGVQRFHVHQLRHTFACQWLERGGSLAALQQVLGHSTVVTTQRYARLDEDAIRREAVKVQSVADSVANGARRQG
jgi:integrase